MVSPKESSSAFTPHEEDHLRASLYAFLARVLSEEPDEEVLSLVKSFSGDETELGQAFNALASAAESADVEGLRREYHDLFIGLGRGELLPFASYYLTGFLNEKPLAKLRDTMAAIGIERDPKVKEPEDHIGAVMDMMSGLIMGRFAAPADLNVQKSFFKENVVSWAPYFFKDLENAEMADFYKPIGRIGKHFMEIEAAAFGMS